MALKRRSDEDCLRPLREIEVHLADGSDVGPACHVIGVGDATHYTWSKKFGGMGRPRLTELKTLQRENQPLKKIMADLELDKLILKESQDILKPRG